MTLEEKLQHLRTAAMEDARAQSNTIISEYQQSLDKLFAEYKEEKMAQAEITVRAETANVEHKINKALAQEHLAVKSMFTKKHHELKQKLFEEVRTMLNEFRLTPDYKTLLFRQVQKARDFANGQTFYILLDAADESLIDPLRKETGADIRISEESFLGGTRAIIPDRHILIEESFENKLQEAYETFMFNRRAHHE